MVNHPWKNVILNIHTYLSGYITIQDINASSVAFSQLAVLLHVYNRKNSNLLQITEGALKMSYSSEVKSWKIGISKMASDKMEHADGCNQNEFILLKEKSNSQEPYLNWQYIFASVAQQSSMIGISAVLVENQLRTHK